MIARRPHPRPVRLLARGQSLALLPVALLLAAAGPGLAGSDPETCGGLAPLLLHCGWDEVEWRDALTVEFGAFTGRLLVLATWVTTPGLTFQQGLICEGPGLVAEVPEGPGAALPAPSCQEYRHPGNASIPRGAPVTLTCDAQSRNLAPEVWVGPAGPWACGQA